MQSQILHEKIQAITRLLEDESGDDILRALGLITLLRDEWGRELLSKLPNMPPFGVGEG